MAIDLQKRAENVGIVLEKRGINLSKLRPVRVACALDVSYSAVPLFASGIMQETHDRIMGIAMKLDDNGEVDTWAFSNDSVSLPTAKADDYGSYIGRNITNTRNRVFWNGTEYSPVMRDILETMFPTVETDTGFFQKLFGRKPSYSATEPHEPVWCLFVTDGQNSDRLKARQVIEASFESSKPIFWTLIGVGDPSEFGFLKAMECYSNVEHIFFESLDVSDDVIYNTLISSKFSNWLKQF